LKDRPLAKATSYWQNISPQKDENHLDSIHEIRLFRKMKNERSTGIMHETGKGPWRGEISSNKA